MKTIEKFEKAISEKVESLKAVGINGTLFWAYRTSKEVGNELIDFSNVIWETEVNEIAGQLKEHNIDAFTISSQHGTATLIAEFQEHGYVLDGIVEVVTERKNFDTGEYEQGYAFKLVRAKNDQNRRSE